MLPGPFIGAMQTGTLRVTVDGSAQVLHPDHAAEAASHELSVSAGDGLVLLTGVAPDIRNREPVPAVALVAGVFPTTAVQPVGSVRSAVERWPYPVTPVATVQPLAGGWMVDPPEGEVVLEMSRETLQPGDSETVAATGAALLAVEAGALTIRSQQGPAWLQPADGPDAWIEPGTVSTLLPDDGAMLQAGAEATLRNDGSGPLLVLVLTVAPDTAIPVDTGSGDPSPQSLPGP